ncbi:hypothetical protein OIU34_21230 [Pararhizobium sp. BT-229]|uniref:hypothetical protein n=1 Tax=Pararhizobium sp. BT-229 TaxID=2986923 RepID=UPI0021F79898|nr:hypothetical protein [Pararhizobium sp. BT-229]MCV9964415.1 hypothetical protein [Pararhizobium sp. BT-229]
MGILNVDSLEKFTHGEPLARVGSRASLMLDSAVGKDVEDISYADAGRWVIEEIEGLDLADERAIRARICASEEKLSDLKACALWPISAHAHMQLVHQLRHLLIDEIAEADDADADMAFATASRWADDEVMKVNLKDPFAIADRIAVSAQKLESKENCRIWPGSAYAHRKVVTELTVFLKRTRGTLH